MFSGRRNIAKMKVEKPANVLNNYLRIPQNAIYIQKSIRLQLNMNRIPSICNVNPGGHPC